MKIQLALTILFLTACGIKKEDSAKSFSEILNTPTPQATATSTGTSLPPIHLATSCEDFTGHWDGMAENGIPAIYQGIVIEFDHFSGMLTLSYNVDSHDSFRQFSEAYLADGRPHQGHVGSTGKDYVAKCVDSAIEITRDMPLLIAPLHTSFTYQGELLKYKSFVTGSSENTGTYRKRAAP